MDLYQGSNLLWPESCNSTFFLSQPPPPPPPEDALLMMQPTVDVCHYQPDLIAAETRYDDQSSLDLDEFHEILKYELDFNLDNVEEEDPALESFAAFLEGVIIEPEVEDDDIIAAEEEDWTTTVHESQQHHQMAIQPTAIIAGPSEEEDWTMALPSGVKFRPTDVELINNYLRVEYVNGYIPRGIISTVDVYDYEPDQLPALAVDHGDGKFYFFTRVKKLGKSKTDRTVKSKTGFWRANQSKLIKDENGIRIGSKMSLTYYNNNKIKTQWLMTEYKLESSSEHSSDYELVLAVVYYFRRRNDDEQLF